MNDEIRRLVNEFVERRKEWRQRKRELREKGEDDEEAADAEAWADLKVGAAKIELIRRVVRAVSPREWWPENADAVAAAERCVKADTLSERAEELEVKIERAEKRLEALREEKRATEEKMERISYNTPTKIRALNWAVLEATGRKRARRWAEDEESQSDDDDERE